MLQRRDVQFVRTAVRWRLLTAEQGEDVLFLCKKFEGKLSVEEIVRRRAYLDDASIEELAEAAARAGGRSTSSPRAPASRGGPGVEGSKRAPHKAAVVSEDTHFDPEGFRSGGPGEIVRPAEPPSLGRWASDVDDPSSDSPRPGRAGRHSRGQAPPSARPQLPDVLGAPTHPYGAELSDEDDEEKTVVTLMPPLPRLRSTVDGDGDEAYKTQRVSALDLERGLRTGAGAKPAPSKVGSSESSASSAPALDVRPSASDLPPIDRFEMAHQLTMIYPELVGKAVAEAVAPSARRPRPAREGAREAALEGKLGPYTVLRPIARGSRGVLYRARGPDGVSVALKVLHRDVSQEVDFIAEFRASAARAAEIESPYVVRILDVGLVGVRPYLATEYVEAWSLEERLASGERPNLVEALSIARDIARALAAAQAKGVVHGDVSPTNILVGRESRGYLTNFVLARATPGYAAPEIAIGRPEPTLASDLYGLGATLFAMLTGQRPDEAGGAGALGGMVPEASAEVVDIVKRLLVADPGARPRRADEVAGWLDAAAARARAAFDARAARSFSPEAQRQLLLRAVGWAGATLTAALGSGVGVRISGLLGGPSAGVSLRGALVGAVALLSALLLFAALGLVRRGELPLPASSAWLVRLQEGTGALGAALLVLGLALAPLALLNVVVALFAAGLLVSWIYGILLRRTIARLRADRGVGRMLAVLGHPSMGAWRMVHAPMLATLALLASLRFAVLAYFAGG